MAEEGWKDDRFFAWIIFRVILSLIIVAIVISLFSTFAFGRMMMPYPDWLWSLFGLLIFIWLLSWIFRPLFFHGYWGHGHEMRILRRRLARGDITEAEFKRKMKILRDSHKND